MVLFVVLFAASGIGNGSTFRTIGVIFDRTKAGPVLGWTSAIGAYGAARRVSEEGGSLLPPKHILNAPTKLMKQEGYGKGYAYDHDEAEAFSGQNYFPDGMRRQEFYQPVDRGFEREIKKRLEYWARLRERRGLLGPAEPSARAAPRHSSLSTGAWRSGNKKAGDLQSHPSRAQNVPARRPLMPGPVRTRHDQHDG